MGSTPPPPGRLAHPITTMVSILFWVKLSNNDLYYVTAREYHGLYCLQWVKMEKIPEKFKVRFFDLTRN